TAGSIVGLLVKVSIPANAPAGATSQINLSAAMSFTNASPALNYALTSSDKLTVLGAASAGVQLIKSVNSTLAAPGATLIYTIAFTNMGASPVTQLVISDETPAYTTFVATSSVSIPTGLGTMTSTAPAVGAAGALRWSFNGQLNPGATGSIQFSVLLTP